MGSGSFQNRGRAEYPCDLLGSAQTSVDFGQLEEWGGEAGGEATDRQIPSGCCLFDECFRRFCAQCTATRIFELQDRGSWTRIRCECSRAFCALVSCRWRTGPTAKRLKRGDKGPMTGKWEGTTLTERATHAQYFASSFPVMRR